MNDKIRISLLRGVCQLPAYVAHHRGFFTREGIDSSVSIAPTAWLIPDQLARGETDFAVIPWTRVAVASSESPLVLLSGSGCEEAAVVVRAGLTVDEVRSVAVPREGGMKDLTAMGLLESLNWSRDKVQQLRFPSGDGAIICLNGKGSDAASMIEPYATMMEVVAGCTVVRRTGDLWPGAPGCSLATSAAMLKAAPDLVQRVVNAYAAATTYVHNHPTEAAATGAPVIGVHPDILLKSLDANRPDINAVRNTGAMDQILKLMLELGYVDEIPRDYSDLSFLDRAQQCAT